VYCITDACGDVSKEAHEMAIQRMVESRVRPYDFTSIFVGVTTRLTEDSNLQSRNVPV
jgi:hypothetical protein